MHRFQWTSRLPRKSESARILTKRGGSAEAELLSRVMLTFSGADERVDGEHVVFLELALLHLLLVLLAGVLDDLLVAL